MLKRILVVLCILLVGAASGGALVYYLNVTPGGILTVLSRPAPRSPHYIGPSGEFAGEGFSGAVNAVRPSVVNISALRTGDSESSRRGDPFFEFFSDFFSPRYEFGLEKNFQQQSTGSGVIVSSDGLIITNNHVVEAARTIRVTLHDKRVFEAEVVGSDPKTDLAVLRIATTEQLPEGVAWADSDQLNVGDFVLAVGNPFGLNHTVTMGIISAKGRADVGISDYEDFIQTDAAINPGNSGGPLINRYGDLVGINTAIFTQNGGYQGIGFAVAGNMVRTVMQQLVTNGRVVRGWLGVGLQELTPELGQAFGLKSLEGALVSETLPGSPAASAGISKGDIIQRYNDHNITGPSMLRNLVALSPPNESITLELIRNGKPVKLTVQLVEQPGKNAVRKIRPQPRKVGDALSGLSVIALTEDVARQLNLPGNTGGVAVVGVEEGSPSALSGVRRGDVIHEVNSTPISGLDDFQNAASTTSHSDAVLMYITRSAKKQFITVSVR